MIPFLILIFISFVAVAEDRFKPVNGGVSDKKQAESIMDDPEVKGIYDQCEKDPSFGGRLKDYSSASDPGHVVGCFNEALKNLNPKLYERAKEEVLSAKKAKDKSEKFNVGSLIDNKKSPEIKKLEEYLSKRLSDSLYADIKGNNPNFVDPGTFYSLYDTQLSKNIISAASSYCLDTNSDLSFYIPISDNIDSTRKENLKKLQKIKTGINSAYADWAGCIKGLETLCAEGAKEPSDDALKKKVDVAETNRRSCEVNNYIKSMRQNLIATQQIQEQMKSLKNNRQVAASAKNVTSTSKQPLTGNRDKQINEYQSNKKGETFDDLTSVTSSELEKSKYTEVVNDKNAQKQKCAQETAEASGACKDLYYTNEELKDAKKNLAEIALNLQIKKDQIEEIGKNDTDNKKLIEFLKQEGRSQEEIDKIMSEGETKLKAIKDNIISQAENEKKALIASYAKKIKDNEKPQQGITPTLIKPDALKNLIHYNNIVSGYLEIQTQGDDKKENKGNTYILYKELNDKPPSRETASGDNTPPAGDYDPNLTKKMIEESGLKEGGPTAENSKLDVKTLNTQILGH